MGHKITNVDALEHQYFPCRYKTGALENLSCEGIMMNDRHVQVISDMTVDRRI